jgi:hypothetical protein
MLFQPARRCRGTMRGTLRLRVCANMWKAIRNHINQPLRADTWPAHRATRLQGIEKVGPGSLGRLVASGNVAIIAALGFV